MWSRDGVSDRDIGILRAQYPLTREGYTALPSYSKDYRHGHSLPPRTRRIYCTITTSLTLTFPLSYSKGFSVAASNGSCLHSSAAVFSPAAGDSRCPTFPFSQGRNGHGTSASRI